MKKIKNYRTRRLFADVFFVKLIPGLIFSFLALWDSFLELRIKLQRATITCNCLPTSTISDDDELREVIDESKKTEKKKKFDFNIVYLRYKTFS
jgi:hypothetical protein